MKMSGTGFFVRMVGVCLVIAGLAACSGGGSSSSGTGSSGTVAGVVKDAASGAPLAGVTVSDGTATATTDATGHFSLARQPGSYTLTASAAGYEATSRCCSVAAGSCTTIDWYLTAAHAAYQNYDNVAPSQQIPAAGMNYVILAWNDLGMHCAQDDYSHFMILPPFNTLHAQVFKRGEGVVTSGVTVSYAFPNKTDSTLHTNFWNYTSRYQFRSYGWNTTPNRGITGTPLAGTMSRDANGIGFVATGIPITPYDDNGTWDPYGKATITVTDNSSGAVLATTSVVAPISTELNCSNCHGATNTFLNILQSHDTNSGTHLVADRANGTLHLCAECHGDNALGLSGKPGVKNLSLAMHGFHQDKVNVSADPNTPDCYNCHPGPQTRCLRGEMYHVGKECKDCHGDLAAMTAGLTAGRQPWLQEPRCADCHDAKHQENPNTLYRNSRFMNSPASEMNGKIYCEACHNSTHAEYTSTNPADNGIPMQLQGDTYWIWNCYVCHNDYMPMPSMHQ
ncbi:carboxypeptidase-like regulatory domain-containing protein [Geomonas sp. Red32]|uniref:carboxypeptidase regulatory-like domain-containing protein n=1 Tax=Geomonas sp. Red32 TaxID=2912856 RepID=UPI00202CCD4B|nr:carboxypeptidase regulatory-like domain-containing protein [Geomonas sp. Red32]MCM0080869.1 carboxypeptidase-like regulatory domain-containing protein [Geomonas sp. Red32]